MSLVARLSFIVIFFAPATLIRRRAALVLALENSALFTVYNAHEFPAFRLPIQFTSITFGGLPGGLIAPTRCILTPPLVISLDLSIMGVRLQ